MHSQSRSNLQLTLFTFPPKPSLARNRQSLPPWSLPKHEMGRREINPLRAKQVQWGTETFWTPQHGASRRWQIMPSRISNPRHDCCFLCEKHLFGMKYDRSIIKKSRLHMFAWMSCQHLALFKTQNRSRSLKYYSAFSLSLCTRYFSSWEQKKKISILYLHIHIVKSYTCTCQKKRSTSFHPLP